MLAQPITDVLAGKKNVLLAGCGGGYDVLGAVPLLHELRARSAEAPNVHLASLSFAYLNGLDHAAQDTEHPNLYAVTAAAATDTKYCPEAWLAHFLDARYAQHAPHTIHSFDKTGVRPLHDAYAALVERHAIDAIVLVDGGIDALLRGDERSIGTPSEDLATLAAVHALAAAPTALTRILACVGMGSELRDGICHADALERIATLTRRRAFLGAAAMVTGTAAGDLYAGAVEHVFANQALLKRSHVHACITSACAGEFGDKGPHVWLSPLLSMYWFFDAEAVAADHVFLPELAGTESIWEVAARVEAARKALPVRDRTTIPL